MEIVFEHHWRDIIRQNQEDSEIATIRSRVEAGCTSKYMVHDGVLYYLSGRDKEVSLKMVIPEKLRAEILDQCLKRLGHLGIDKTYGLIMRNYYWPKLFNDVVNHVKKCVTCQVQSRGSRIAPVLETDVPNYPFQKVSMDISWPYGETHRGNLYRVLWTG